jgi:hypothetical protein
MFLGPESKASYYLGIKDIKIGELQPHPGETRGFYFPVLQEAAFERRLLVFVHGGADIIGHWWPGILSLVELPIPECPFMGRGLAGGFSLSSLYPGTAFTAVQVAERIEL